MNNPSNNNTYVYLYSDLDKVESHRKDWDAVRGLLGGKGANLADMTRLEIPVPPGFTVTTEACNAYLAAGEQFPEGMWEQELKAITAIESATGKKFGDAQNPLLVSCRSGAKFSMPGMMDTILNIGLNDDVVKGMVEKSGDARFVYDLYRRLVQMFGSVVMEVPDEVFEAVITAKRKEKGVASDSDLSAEDWQLVTTHFKEIYQTYTGSPFPADPLEQLKLATEAVFKSWNGKRAIDYRNAAGIAHDLGTAVNIQTMVFGNMGSDSLTGVAMSRNASTGENVIEGDFLYNAQGEDVVAGIRITQTMDELKQEMPAIYKEFSDIASKLEQHARNMQDMEFTVEQGKLWLLQTRDGKRTAQAEVKIAVDMVEEGMITKAEAVARVQPSQIDFFLHPQLDPKAVKSATVWGNGLNVSPGAAVGKVALDADIAEKWAKDGEPVIMVRPETKPDDVHGMLASQGIITSRGGRTSHAALVARQFGKPAVVGVEDLTFDWTERTIALDGITLHEGDWVSLDGTNGTFFQGEIPTVVPSLENPELSKLLSWADEIRKLEVWANSDYPRDAQKAKSYGAQGIGLCRTEHMFFETSRLPVVQKMIMAKELSERKAALAELFPLQCGDFEGLFKVMGGDPVVIRLLDPPLHEFLPAYEELMHDITDLKMKIQHASELDQLNAHLDKLRVDEDFLTRVEALGESNPMLGTRGVRLGIVYPEIVRMQVRAIFEAAVNCKKSGVDVRPKIMIPLISHINELKLEKEILEEEAKSVLAQHNVELNYEFGTMIEIPRAAITADELAEVADFFSFGTNDLTQMTFGVSRDDAEAGFLVHYLGRGLLQDSPFDTLDQKGVGSLMQLATQRGRSSNPDLHIGICGEHGGDPRSIAFCHRIGLDYVSCSPYRVPVARLAAAHAALKDEQNS